jgi:hypothetical protein
MVRFQAGTNYFLFYKVSTPAVRSNQPSSKGIWSALPSTKRFEREDYHLPPRSRMNGAIPPFCGTHVSPGGYGLSHFIFCKSLHSSPK